MGPDIWLAIPVGIDLTPDDFTIPVEESPEVNAAIAVLVLLLSSEFASLVEAHQAGRALACAKLLLPDDIALRVIDLSHGDFAIPIPRLFHPRELALGEKEEAVRLAILV